MEGSPKTKINDDEVDDIYSPPPVLNKDNVYTNTI